MCVFINDTIEKEQKMLKILVVLYQLNSLPCSFLNQSSYTCHMLFI